MVENALSDARNIEKLSNGLMDLAKASYNTEQISMSAIRLDEVLLDASAMVMKAHSGYNVDLRFEDDTEDDGMVTIRGNDYLLRTAFVNLIEIIASSHLTKVQRYRFRFPNIRYLSVSPIPASAFPKKIWSICSNLLQRQEPGFLTRKRYWNGIGRENNQTSQRCNFRLFTP